MMLVETYVVNFFGFDDRSGNWYVLMALIFH